MFMHVDDVELLIPRAPEMSSNWDMRSLSISGGSLFEKKSLRAVATAFTGMSSECMSTLPSLKKQSKISNIILNLNTKYE